MDIREAVGTDQGVIDLAEGDNLSGSRAILKVVGSELLKVRVLLEGEGSRQPKLRKDPEYIMETVEFLLGMIHAYQLILELPSMAREFISRLETR